MLNNIAFEGTTATFTNQHLSNTANKDLPPDTLAQGTKKALRQQDGLGARDQAGQPVTTYDRYGQLIAGSSEQQNSGLISEQTAISANTMQSPVSQTGSTSTDLYRDAYYVSDSGTWSLVDGHAVELTQSLSSGALEVRVEILQNDNLLTEFYQISTASTAPGGAANVVALENGAFVPITGQTYQVRVYVTDFVTDSKGTPIEVGETLVEELDVTIGGIVPEDTYRDAFYLQDPSTGTWSREDGHAIEFSQSFSFSSLQAPRVEVLQNGNIISSFSVSSHASTAPGGATNVVAFESEGFTPVSGESYQVRLYLPEIVTDDKGIPSVVGETLAEETSVTIGNVVSEESYRDVFYSNTGVGWSLMSGHAVELNQSIDPGTHIPSRIEIVQNNNVLASFNGNSLASTAPGGALNVVALENENFVPIAGETYQVHVYTMAFSYDSAGCPTYGEETLSDQVEVTIPLVAGGTTAGSVSSNPENSSTAVTDGSATQNHDFVYAQLMSSLQFVQDLTLGNEPAHKRASQS